MKKLQTLVLAMALVALGSVSWAATSLKSSPKMQKGTPPPETDSINLNSSRSNIYRVKVTHVRVTDKTFTVEVNFSAAKLNALPKVGEIIDTTFIQTPGGPMEASTIKSSKSNTSERLAAGQLGVTGKVTKVNKEANTFTVEVTFSAKNLKDTFPEVGKIYDITFTGSTTPGGPLEATTVRGSKSNGSERSRMDRSGAG